MRKSGSHPRTRAMFLTLTALCGGIANVSFCSTIDIKHNIVSGTMDFIAGYAEDFLTALFPAPDELVGQNQE